MSAGFGSDGQVTPIDIPVRNLLDDVGDMVSQPGLFDRVFSSLKDAAISVTNFLTPLAIAAVPDIISSLNERQIINGLSETLSNNADAIFDRPTIEKVFNTEGGIDGILATGTIPVTLPDSTAVNGYVFSDTTTLLFDADGNFIGQIKNGRYESGDFGIRENREFYLKTGYVYEDLGEGLHLEAEVIEGKLEYIDIKAPNDEDFVSIERRPGSEIIIDESGEVIDGIIDVIHGAAKFIIENGQTIQIFTGTAEASVDLSPDLAPIVINPLDFRDITRNFGSTDSDTGSEEEEKEWYITFMNAGRFAVTCSSMTICEMITPNPDNEVFATDYFDPIFDTPKQIVDLLQLGNSETGMIENDSKGQYFVIYKTPENPIVRSGEILREYYNELNDEPATGLPTGRMEHVFSGPVIIGDKLIQASQNNIITRIRAWFKLLNLGF